MATVKKELQKLLEQYPEYKNFDVYIQIIYIDEDGEIHDDFTEDGPWCLSDVCDGSEDNRQFYSDCYDYDINEEEEFILLKGDSYEIYSDWMWDREHDEPDDFWW